MSRADGTPGDVLSPMMDRPLSGGTATARSRRRIGSLAAVPRQPAPAAPEPAPATGRHAVVIADPDPLARRVVRDVLQATPDLVVAGTAPDWADAFDLARHYRPAVLLTEATLGHMDGVELIRQLALDAPDVRTVLLTVAPSDELALRALRAGACGVLAKDLPVEAVARAVRRAAEGEAVITRELTLRVIETLREVPEGFAGMRPVRSPLTPREWEVLDLISSGLGTREIADRLVVTQDTVYSHVKSLLRKLGVSSRAEALVAVEQLRRPQAASA